MMLLNLSTSFSREYIGNSVTERVVCLFYYFHFCLIYTSKDLLYTPEPIEETTEKTIALIAAIFRFCCCLANYINLII